jgi:glycine/D-amino acid oxidase-like deaminating enzyme/nitrite reductase/ring-hydroxylating ferredoxin subunit
MSGAGARPSEPVDVPTERNPSLWIATTPRTGFGPLPVPGEEARTYDVVVVGGGIVGLTVAWHLKQAGRTVAVIDARRVAEGVSGYTTAKLTALHGVHLHEILEQHGEAAARAYAEANQAAIAEVRERVRTLGIDCDLVDASAFTYAEEPDQVGVIEAEASALRRVGLPGRLTRDVGLPFDVAAAVELPDQARFHPRRYLLALAQALPGAGCDVFEGTTATGLHDGDPCRVVTDRGEVQGRQVVVASHQPFALTGSYFARLGLKRSYVIAVALTGAVPRGLYISVEPSFHSMRPQPLGAREVLLVGGEPHRPGSLPDTRACLERLEAWARERLGATEVLFRWSTHDTVALDGLPLVGPMTAGTERILVATGFGGWGMTNGTAAARMLADRILGRENPWARTFDPHRQGLLARAEAILKDAVEEARNVASTPLDHKLIADLQPGEGVVASWGFDREAVCRDDAGAFHRVSAACSHLGCLVQWNHADGSWDCPCHGSRFAPDGRVLHGPATRPLRRRTAD